MSYAFSEVDGGTHIEICLARPKPKDTAFLEHVVEEFRKNITNEMASLKDILAHDRHDGGMEEPELRASGDGLDRRALDKHERLS